MKKALKVYGWSWVALIATTVVTIAVMITIADIYKEKYLFYTHSLNPARYYPTE